MVCEQLGYTAGIVSPEPITHNASAIRMGSVACTNTSVGLAQCILDLGLILTISRESRALHRRIHAAWCTLHLVILLIGCWLVLVIRCYARLTSSGNRGNGHSCVTGPIAVVCSGFAVPTTTLSPTLPGETYSPASSAPTLAPTGVPPTRSPTRYDWWMPTVQ